MNAVWVTHDHSKPILLFPGLTFMHNCPVATELYPLTFWLLFRSCLCVWPWCILYCHRRVPSWTHYILFAQYGVDSRVHLYHWFCTALDWGQTCSDCPYTVFTTTLTSIVKQTCSKAMSPHHSTLTIYYVICISWIDQVAVESTNAAISLEHNSSIMYNITQPNNNCELYVYWKTLFGLETTQLQTEHETTT